MKKTKPTFELWEVILIALVTSVIMSLTTSYALYSNHKIGSWKDVTNNKHLGNFLNSYNSIINEYYEDVDEEGLVNAAINGMVEYLDDPYTTYLNEQSKDLLMDSLKGEYEGIGVRIGKNEADLIEVYTVYENTPASESGILVGDIFKFINDVDLTEKSPEDAVNIIKNTEDKNVKIDVLRNGEPLTFNLIRKSLFVPAVESETFENNGQKIGYINISKFSDTVYQQFNLKLKALEEQGITSLIIDVRNNTGGYLKGSKDIASLFLEEGKTIYTLKNNLETSHYKDETKEKREYKVAIIMNKNTASASEVLAGALKHSYGATLIGTTSYGKGSVQQVNDKTMMKYTTAKWLMPNGKNIDNVGITPDINVENILEEGETLTREKDLQLNTAINELSK